MLRFTIDTNCPIDPIIATIDGTITEIYFSSDFGISQTILAVSRTSRR